MATDLQLQVAIMPDFHDLISPLFIHSHTTDTDWKIFRLEEEQASGDASGD